MKLSSFFLPVCCLGALFSSASAEVIISELMARGGHELLDEDEERQDWIELHNSGSKAVALQEFALTDDTEDLLKWKLPERELKPGGFLTIFASGKDRSQSEAPLHANFKLNGDGEYLALVQIEGKKVVSDFDPYFPSTGRGESIGYPFKKGVPDLEKALIFLTPTPGKTNGETGIAPSESKSGEDLTLAKVFPADRVIEVQITVAEEDWDTIRKQTRNLFEVLSEKRKEAPIEGPYTYVNASVTIDGHRFANVGLRKKGFIGSQSQTRPSLKLKLNHVDKKGGIEGLTNLTLNNNKQDGSLVNQFLGYGLFNAAGSPAPRCSFARVTLNGKNLGIYSHVETVRKPIIKRTMGNDRGTLYEGTVVDFREGWEGSFEKKFGSDKRGRPMIKRLIEVLEGDSEGEEFVAELGELVDLEAFYKFWAMEGLLGFWDGYSGNQNNYFVYFNPENGKFHFMPWGTDVLFDKYSELDPNRDAPISVKSKGMVAHKLYQSESGRERYAKAMKVLLTDVWNEEELLSEIDRIEQLLKPHLHSSQGSHSKELEGVRAFVRARRGDIVKEISDGMPLWTKVPKPPPVIPSNLAAGLNSDTPFSAAKKGELAAIKKHLAKGADVNGQDFFGSSPLSLAAWAGEVEAVSLLIKEGANVNLTNKENQTALHTAAFLGRLEVVQALVENKAKLNARNDKGESPLDVCAGEWSPELEGIIQFVGGLLQLQVDLEEVKAGRPRTAAYLREQGSKLGADLPKLAADNLWEAAKNGDLELLRKLLAGVDVDPNGQDEIGLTPLSWACITGELGAAKLLLENGAKVDERNKDQGNSLHAAAFFGHLEVVDLLINKKADLNLRNGSGETPFSVASAEWNGQQEGIVRFLIGFLKIKADVEAIKESRPKISALLRKHGGKPSADLNE